jgi:hypothetical protein
MPSPRASSPPWNASSSTATTANPPSPTDRRVRLHRGLLQPPTPPLDPPLRQPRHLRAPAHLTSTSRIATLSTKPGQLQVVGRDAACGIAADNLLTGRPDLCRLPGSDELPPQYGPPRSCRTTQRSRSNLELMFDTLVRWGHGTTQTWAGRSRLRCSGARSCSASTWPPSRRWPPTSSPISVLTAPGSGA